MTLDLEQTVSGLREWLVEDQGLVQQRVDRFVLNERRYDAGQFDFYIEVGTVYGEVRVRIHAGGKRVETVDIRSANHLPNAKKRIAAQVKRGTGMEWRRGQGWVKKSTAVKG